MSDFKLYTHRSGLETWERCRRLYYLEYLFQGRGIRTVSNQPHFAIGTARHAGVEALWHGESIDQAVHVADQVYLDEVKGGIIDLEESPHIQLIQTEHRAIVEAGLRVWAAVRLPVLRNEYAIFSAEGATEIEKDHLVELAPGIAFLFRVDAVLQNKTDDKLYQFSLKNPKQFDEEDDARGPAIDNQGCSETWGTGTIYGHDRVGGVIMEYIQTGRQTYEPSEDPDQPGMPIRWYPGVRGWRAAGSGLENPLYAWKWQWDNPEHDPRKEWHRFNNAKTRRLAKKDGWVRTTAWEYPGGVEAWVADLLAGRFVPQNINPLPSLLGAPEPYYRNAPQVDEWRESAISNAQDILERKERLESGESLNRTFPKSKTMCMKWGKPCSMWKICHEGVLNPIGSQYYKWREPHHPLEVVAKKEGDE